MIYGIDGRLNGIFNKQNRISITQNPETRKYQLSIKTFSEEDEGHYQCDTVMNGKTLKVESTVVLAGKKIFNIYSTSLYELIDFYF